MKLNDISIYLNELLQPERFNDHCPNGLQIEGKSTINKIVTGVTASFDLLQAAHHANADAILVHHGYFWRSEPLSITGIKKRRIEFLLQHNINLFAYHLPLDAHAEIGNNVMLAKQFGLTVNSCTGDKNMLALAELNQATTLQKFAQLIEFSLKRSPMVIGEPQKTVSKIAICTGAAQHYMEQAIDADVDVFVSGEISEQTVHLARESGVAYIAAGHHATERYGIKALGEHLASKFDLQHEFIDCDNPV